MSRSSLLLLAACLVAIQFVGCATMEPWFSANGKSTHGAKSKSMEERTADFDADEVDEFGDPLNSVGDESRAGLVIDEPLDPWFGKYNYADKGRDIARSLR